MQSHTKNALRARMLDWQQVQERIFTSVSRLPRPAQQEEYVARLKDRKRDKRRKRRIAAKKAAEAFANAAGGGGSGDGAAAKAALLAAEASSDSSSDVSVTTLTGCEDEEILQIYPTLSRKDQKTLKNEDKLAVAQVSNSVEFLSAKVEFLEDMLFLYQQEIDYQVKVNTSATYVKELQGDLNASEDRVAFISTQLRKALDEVTAVKREKEQAIQALTVEFQRTIQRENERHEVALRDYEHEKALLKAKIKSVEAAADDSVAVAKATSTSEAVATRNRIENYIQQIKTLEDSVQQEQKLRSQLESDLWEATQKLQSNDKVNDLVGLCSRKLQEVVAKELRNQRHVYGELAKTFAENSSGAWRWEGDPNGIVALSIRAAAANHHMNSAVQHSIGGKGASSSKHRGGQQHNDSASSLLDPTAPPTFLRSAAADEGDVNALYSDILKDLFPSEFASQGTGDSGSSPNTTSLGASDGAISRSMSQRNSKGGGAAGSAAAAGASATSSLENFLRVADKLNTIIAQYQGDLLQCVGSGCQALLAEKRDLKGKLLECYANAELQGRRSEEMLRIWEGQKEMAAAERDRALVLRDRLARQLRMDGGAHDRRLTKNAECQTALQGSSVVAMLSNAGAVPGILAGSGGGGGAALSGGAAAGGGSANGAGGVGVPIVAAPSALKGEGRKGVTIQDVRVQAN